MFNSTSIVLYLVFLFAFIFMLAWFTVIFHGLIIIKAKIQMALTQSSLSR